MLSRHCEHNVAGGVLERAPCGLVYLSAGLAFCFMTQLGRYTNVAKHDIYSYQILHDTSFSPPIALNPKRETPNSSPVATDVFIVRGLGGTPHCIQGCN